MKKCIALSFSFILMFSGMIKAQHVCCAQPSSSQDFAMLANDKSFTSSHASPLPFEFKPENGKMIEYKTEDGKVSKAFEVNGNGKFVVLMFHEWWGLNDYIKQEAERLQKDLGDNVSVLALDLYDGKVASNPEDAGKYMKAVEENRAVSIIKGALNYTQNKKVATIGWCFGGGWSLQAGILAADRGVASVMYYGMPEKNKDKLKALHGPVLGMFAEKDKWITPEVVKEFKKNMKEAGKKLTVNNYNADHAFANPSNPNHDKKASEDAYAKSLIFLKTNLKE